MRGLLWTLGMAFGVALGVAVGGSFIAERGRKALPFVIVLTLISGVLIGWGLNGEFDAIQANAQR